VGCGQGSLSAFTLTVLGSIIGYSLGCRLTPAANQSRQSRNNDAMSVEVLVDVHALVQDAYHVDRISTGADSVVEGV
jgi:hypothetical protein